MLFSRGVDLKDEGAGTGQLGLVPYADLLNHSPYSSSNFLYNSIPFSKDKEVVLYADRPYAVNDQVRGQRRHWRRGTGGLRKGCLSGSKLGAILVHSACAVVSPCQLTRRCYCTRIGRMLSMTSGPSSARAAEGRESGVKRGRTG
jgi:hypothetical protein